MDDNRLLRKADAVLDGLMDILDREQQAIVDADPETLAATSSKKKQLLDELTALQPQLIQVFDGTGGKSQPLLDQTRNKLNRCRDRNTQNRKLTVQGLNVVDKSIGMLKSAIKSGSVRVYGPTGKTDDNAVKRNIGTA